MRLFLRNILFFLLVIIVFFSLNYQVNSYIIKKKKSDFKLGSSVLVVGDSHMVRAIDPTYYEGAKNIAQNSEPYFVSYMKIKELIKNNSLETIILGFSYHNLSTFNDYKLKDPKWSGEMFKRIYSILDYSVIKNISLDNKSYFRTIIENQCLYPKMNHLNYIGNYTNSNNTNFSDTEEVIDRHYFYKNKKAQISSNEIDFFELIMDLCVENKIKLILVTTPLHLDYRNKVPGIFINKLQEIKNEEQSNNVIFLDYSNDPYEFDEFLNGDHLNKKGSKRFTKAIFTKLNEYN